MSRLMLVLLPMIATTLMGIAVIAVLTAERGADSRSIVIAALAGLAVSLPVSWGVGRQVEKRRRP